LRKSFEKLNHDPHGLREARLDIVRNFSKGNQKNFTEGQNAKLNIMDAGKRADVVEPGAEKFVCPATRFQERQGESGVVVEAVDHNLKRDNFQEGGFGFAKGL